MDWFVKNRSGIGLFAQGKKKDVFFALVFTTKQNKQI